MNDSSTSALSGNNEDDCSYKSALKALLSPGIHQATTKEEIARSALRRTKTVSDMMFYWNKILRNTNPHSQNQNKKRPLLVHITGTKGKGSTACMCEAILRHHGYSTGLFTSPHLIDIRERIRWNGSPLHQDVFADVYWKIRKALESDDDPGDNNDVDDPPPKLPGYFRMLTLMGLYTFLHQLGPGRVEVVILEVGMGGRYDATNFLDASYFKKVVYGVTLLDLDHTRILGDTLEKIAWEKGGIISVNKLNPDGMSPKSMENNTAASRETRQERVAPKSPVEEPSHVDRKFASPKLFVIDSNTQGVVGMMKSCADIEGRGADLCLVDATGSKIREALSKEGDLSLGLSGEHQYGNAALAVALCQSLTTKADAANENKAVTTIEIDSPKTLAALVSSKWPGRCQTLEWTCSDEKDNYRSFEFCLDGAHTPQSVEATVVWLQTKRKEGLPILVFNCSHERNPLELLGLFRGHSFSRVYFAKSDSSRPSPVAKASAEKLLEEKGIPIQSEFLSGNETMRTWQETLAIVWKHLRKQATSGSDTHSVPRDEISIRCNMTANQILKEITHDQLIDGESSLATSQVFVTGSLYLVGSFLTALGWSEESSPAL